MTKFLIIDDEPAIARLIAQVAEGCGYTVSVTTEPEAFKDEVLSLNPDVVALDLSMPDADGVELLRYMSAVKCTARILIVSGFDQRVLETAGRLGSALGLRIAGTISKPVRVADLRAAIAAIPITAAR